MISAESAESRPSPLTRVEPGHGDPRPRAGSYEEDGEEQGTEPARNARVRRRSAHDRRAINGPLAKVTRGQPGSLGTARDA